MDAALNTSGATDCSSHCEDGIDTQQNYLYSLVYHDTSKMPPDKQLPFFVDRAGSEGAGTGAAFEIVTVSDQGQCDSRVAAPTIATADDARDDAAAAAAAADSGEGKQQQQQQQQSRRKRKKKQIMQPGDGVDGDSGGGDGIGAKIANAKRRVIDRLKLLAAASPGPPSAASGSTLASTSASTRGGGVGGEMCFLRVINDRLGQRRSDNSSTGDDGDAAGSVADDPLLMPPPSLATAIGLGVKSTAHHAPAFIRVHQSDLDDFLSDMRPDRTLWRVDADDLLGASRSSAMRRRFGGGGGGGGGRYFSDALDPMDAECTVCLKRGHLADTCKRSGPVCILCGREGHPKAECPSRLCPLCLAEGHRAEKCHRYGLLLRCPCDRCGCLGHWKDQCPDIWRQFHSTVAPGCPKRPLPSARQSLAEAESESESEAEAAAVGGAAGWCQFVGEVSRSTYCCNCAQSGHSVHECVQPRSSLNRCLGSFHSQRVRRYDPVDPFAIGGGARRLPDGASRRDCRDGEAAPASSATGHVTGQDVAAAAHRVKAQEADGGSTLPAVVDRYGRPAPQIGESFIPLATTPPSQPPSPPPPQQQQQQQQRHRRQLSFREELDQLRDLARRLLPEGASRSQVKKLSNRLKFWRRNGYQPSTPEQEVQMAYRMEEWVLEVADSHNYMHKLNFKRRCRLLNSTGATLELIRSCRQYGEPPAAGKAADGKHRNKKKKNNKNKKKKKKARNDTFMESSTAQAADCDGGAVASRAVPAAASAAAASAADGSWAGRLRTRPAVASTTTTAAPPPADKKLPRRKRKREEQQKQIKTTAGSKVKIKREKQFA